MLERLQLLVHCVSMLVRNRDTFAIQCCRCVLHLMPRKATLRHVLIHSVPGLQVKHTRVSPKLAFYCLGTTHIPPSAALTFADPPKVVARGHKTNDFAVSYDEAQVKALA